MVRFLLIMVSLYVFTVPAPLWARPGNLIPAPKQDISAAVAKVKAVLAEALSSEINAEFSKKIMNQVAVIKVVYTDNVIDIKTNKMKKMEDWFWIVTLVNRKQSDHSWTYKVDGGGYVTLIDHTI